MIKNLNETERAQLHSLYQQPGWRVFQTICENEIQHLQLDMIQANPTDTAEVVARLNRAQAAAVFYQNVIKGMSGEVEIFVDHQKSGNEIGPDPTAALYE